MNSKFLSLSVRDTIKGLAVAVSTAVLTIAYKTIEAGSLAFDYKLIAKTAAVAALGYLMQKFVTNSKGELLKKDSIHP